MPRRPTSPAPASTGIPATTPAGNPNPLYVAQQQLANQPLAMIDRPHIIVNGVDYGPFPEPDNPPWALGGVDEVPGWQPGGRLEDMPNWDRTSTLERTILRALPGFSESWLGETLTRFGESPAGKVLSFLDVGAEGLERAVGFGAQFLDAHAKGEDETFWRDWQEAWYAGSLAYDSANVEVAYVPNRGFISVNDLPGVTRGTTAARQKIADLVAGGMDYRTALTQTQAEFYESLGALAIRSQTQDMFGHILVDPINLILPVLKPVERARAFRQFLAGTKVTGEGLETIRASTRAAQEAVDAARIAGNAADLGRLEEAASEWSRVLAFAEKNRLTWAEQKFVNLLDFAARPTKLDRLNPFALTPQARASEYLVTVLDNLQTRVIGALPRTPDGSVDIMGALRNVQRIAAGTEGPQLAHMVATIEGRTVKSALSMMGSQAEEMAELYQRLGKLERPLLKATADALGTTVYEVMRRHRAGETAQLFAQLSQKVQADPALAARLDQLLAGAGLDRAALTAEQFGARLDVFKGTSTFYDFGLISDDVAQLELLNRVTDVAARQAMALYGVKARGFLQAASEVLKSAETLAFLRLNPTYPIRNYLNNVATLIARGAWNWGSPADQLRFWQRVGFEPARLREAFTLADIHLKLEAGEAVHPFGQALSTGENVISQAVRGEKGWTTRVSDFFRGVNLGGLDTGQMSARIEAAASARAMTTGYQRGWSYFWRPGKVADLDPNLARALGPANTRALEQAVRSSLSEADLDALYVTERLHVSTAALTDGVERKLGGKLENILDADVRGIIESELLPAVGKGDDAIGAALTRIRNRATDHFARLQDEALQTMAEEAAARVTAEGPQGYVRLFSDITDDWWAAHERHASVVAQINDELRAVADPKLVDARWRQFHADEMGHWERAWNRFDARVRGLVQAGKNTGLDTGPIVEHFQAWRKGWKDFFTWRDRELAKYFKARLEGKSPARTFEDLQGELDARYLRMTEDEVQATRAIDQAAARLLPEDQRALFTAWRERVNAWRQADRELVVDFRKQVRQAPPEERPALYTQHWQERQGMWARTWQEERRGLAALQGDQAAREAYSDAASAARADFNALDQLFPRLMGADPDAAPLTMDEAGQWSGIIRRYATPDEAHRLDEIARLDADEALHPPQVPTPEGAAALERQAQVEVLPRAVDDNPITNQLTAATVKKYFNTKGQSLAGKTVWHNRATGEWKPWKVQPPDASGEWSKLPGHEVDAWIEMVYERLTGGRGEIDANEMWARIEAAYRARQAGRRAGAEVPAEVPMMPDPAALERAAERQLERQEIEFAVYERLLGRTEEAARTEASTLPTLPDLDALVKPELYSGVGLDQLWQTRGEAVLEALGEEARAIAAPERTVSVRGFTPTQAKAARAYVENARLQMSSARYNSVRFAEYVRDSALLNYNRRFNYNTWLGTVFPYEFWFTQSAFKWALHSIDRPAMLSSYLRLRKFLETAYKPEPGRPSRLRGNIRIPLPFLPEWMGDMYVDPFQSLLPFDQWSYPFEQRAAQETRDEGVAERKLEELYNDGEITQAQLDLALSRHSGPLWERAVSLAQTDDAEGRYNDVDFITGFLNPHAPLLWAYERARNREPGAVLPLTRTIGGVANMLGIDPAGPYNPEAALRKQLGLHPFDRWDDYRVERMLANMAAMGEISPQTARVAMIDHAGPAWEEAQRKAYDERWPGAVGVMGSVLGLPPRFYPEGEQRLRALSDDYQRAWERYEATGGDYPSTVGAFLSEHPEYEARLSLFKKPDERLHDFLVDEVWDQWNALPTVHKQEVKEQLGPLFRTAFLEKPTRNTDAIDAATLALWARLMGGTTPGKLERTVGAGTALELSDPQAAWKAQYFYTLRSQMFPYSWDQQDEYFSLEEGAARKSYLRTHPELKMFWSWREDWLKGNPEAAALIDDDPPKYASEEEMRAYQAAPEPNLTWQEWRQTLGWELSNLIEDYTDAGDPLPGVARERLELEMARVGWSGDLTSFVAHIAGSRELDYGYITP